MTEPVYLPCCAECNGCPECDPGLRPTAENDAGLRQVWCVAYDNPTPSMDGAPPPIRMADQDYDIALRNFEFMQRQQRVAPKRNLRIETRWVSDYTTVIPPGDGHA